MADCMLPNAVLVELTRLGILEIELLRGIADRNQTASEPAEVIDIQQHVLRKLSLKSERRRYAIGHLQGVVELEQIVVSKQTR